jgi:hypothetical protein
MDDKQAEQNYRQAMGLDCQDASKAYFKRKVKDNWIQKRYKHISKVYMLDKQSLFVIFNKQQ